MLLFRPLLASAFCAWALLVAPPARAEEPPEPLTLERAVQLATERNERVLAARERAQAAEARVARARSFFFPELAATGTYTRRYQEVVRQVAGQDVVIQRQNALGAVATARMALFDLRGIFLYQAASLEEQAAGLEAVEVRRRIGFEAAGAYLATLGSQEVAESAARRLAYTRQVLEDARARAAAGLAGSNDVTRAELELATAEAQLTQASAQAESSRLQLGFLLVAPNPGLLSPPQELLATATRPAESFDPLALQALERRPDLLATKLRVQALEANAREPLARLVPSLGASAVYRLTNEAGFLGRPFDIQAGLDLTWTFFDGGERYAERRERLALARAAGLDLTAQVRQVDVAMEQAQVNLQASQAALRQSEAAVQAARRNAEEAQILYRQGLTTALVVADASLRLFEAEVALARAAFALGTSLLELRGVVGLDALGKEP
jgi:outer membrane protein TolC